MKFQYYKDLLLSTQYKVLICILSEFQHKAESWYNTSIVMALAMWNSSTIQFCYCLLSMRYQFVIYQNFSVKQYSDIALVFQWLLQCKIPVLHSPVIVSSVWGIDLYFIRVSEFQHKAESWYNTSIVMALAM